MFLRAIKSIHHDLSLAQNQLKNFTRDSTCSLLPIVIRPEDLLCLLAPELTNIIRDVCAKI